MSTRRGGQPSKARQPPRTNINITHRVQDHTCQYLDDLEAANARIHRLESRIEEERARHKQELASLQRELSASKTLAERRGKEPSATQGPSTATDHTDRLSVSEACKTVHALNKALLDVSASMIPAMIFHPYSEERRAAAIPSVAEFLGSDVPSILIAESKRNTSELNASLVYTILQVFLIHHCRPLAMEWCPGHEGQSRIFEAVYKSLRSTEEQSIFGRWRALAYSRLTVSESAWRRRLLGALGELLAVAGWKFASDADLHIFKQKLKPIFEAANKVRSALGEMVRSVDLQLLSPAPGTDNKHNSASADDGTIFGTFTFGLDKVTVTEGRITVLTAAIVLDSALREALQPSDSPGAAHTAVLQTGAVPVPTTYCDGVEQHAARNPV